jgi:hypothetical protein
MPLLDQKLPGTSGQARNELSLAPDRPGGSRSRKIAFLGDYLPRKCGIATFTNDLRCAVAAKIPWSQCPVVPVNDSSAGYNYPGEVRFEIAEQELASYARILTRICRSL